MMSDEAFKPLLNAVDRKILNKQQVKVKDLLTEGITMLWKNQKPSFGGSPQSHN